MNKRSFLSTLFLIALLLLPFPAQAAESLSVPGDVDGDGSFSAADAAETLRCMTADGSFPAGDITQNGVTDGTDALAVLWMATGKIPDPVKFVERLSSGLLPESAFPHFSFTGPVDDGLGNYKDDSVSMALSSGSYQGSVYYLADIYLQDIRRLKTGHPEDGVLIAGDYVPKLARLYDAALAVNGDYYTQRSFGPIIRNGVTLSGKLTAGPEVCILGWDGVLTILPVKGLDATTLNGLFPYQAWIFGPGLLDEAGSPINTFSSGVAGSNPRTVLGYYSPGHYAFLVVDGRQGGYSAGLTLKELSKLCARLHFQAAYNLDGGRSSAMAGSDGLVSKPVQGGRHVDDIVYISKPLE